MEKGQVIEAKMSGTRTDRKISEKGQALEFSKGRNSVKPRKISVFKTKSGKKIKKKSLKVMNGNSYFRTTNGGFVNEKVYFDEVYRNNLKMITRMKAIRDR